MLTAAKLVAFVATTDSERAKAFYSDVLGLRLVADEPYALVYDAAGVTLRVQKAPAFTPLPHTVLGWHVASIASAVAALAKHGVSFERYPGMQQDAAGIWSSPSGARVAWFKDPDGNLLSLTEA
jgi:catechol 2,3-dioxygenase-like lactoylglutathione lyase family enzyme